MVIKIQKESAEPICCLLYTSLDSDFFVGLFSETKDEAFGKLMEALLNQVLQAESTEQDVYKRQLIVLFPFYWMVLTSVKSYGSYNAEYIPKFFTLSPTLQNYVGLKSPAILMPIFTIALHQIVVIKNKYSIIGEQKNG